MTRRPFVHDSGAFALVAVASLRVKQLIKGATPRVVGPDKKTTIALHEVMTGAVAEVVLVEPPA